MGSYSLRGILAEQIGMNGEVERPERGGDLAGAQSPYSISSAKTTRKSLSVYNFVIARKRKRSLLSRENKYL